MMEPVACRGSKAVIAIEENENGAHTVRGQRQPTQHGTIKTSCFETTSMASNPGSKLKRPHDIFHLGREISRGWTNISAMLHKVEILSLTLQSLPL